MKKIEDYSLYLVISEEYSMGRSATEAAKSAISGGVDVIQMREKNKSSEGLLRLGAVLSRMCREKGVTFIVNDDPLLAKEVGADGVHLGQGDMKRCCIGMARDIMGGDRMIGVSTHSMEEFSAANDSEADYIAYGPIYFTKTKDYSIGPGDVTVVAGMAKKPVFFIGGIDRTNIGGMLSRGAKNIALIRGILEAEDIASRTSELKEALRKKKEGKAFMIKVNGRNEIVEESMTVSGLIAARGLSPDRIVLEHNLRVVPKEEWPRIILNENDSVEILNFMGGG